jgi:hypothetical protein
MQNLEVRRAMIEVETELLDSPVAEYQSEILNPKPIDMENLSQEEQLRRGQRRGRRNRPRR